MGRTEDTQAVAALAHLRSADPVMAGMIERLGPLHLTYTDDYFFTLVDAIASQQLSGKAAATIVGRIRALVPGKERIEPSDILALPDQALRDAGLSWSKVGYIKDLAARVDSGQVHLGRISEMEDEEIISELVAVKGIGRWTAEEGRHAIVLRDYLTVTRNIDFRTLRDGYYLQARALIEGGADGGRFVN